MKMKVLRKRVFMWIGILTALCTVGIGEWSIGQTSSDEVTIAVFSGTESTLVYVAEAQGYFSANDLNVTFKEFESGKAASDALLAGEADIATSADFVLASNSFDYDDLRVLTTVSEGETIQLVARKDHGITTQNDLRGKKIGVTRKSVGEFFLGTFLLFNNLTLEDVIIVDLTPSQIVESISSGEIDATLTWEPNVNAIKMRLGENSISWPGQSEQAFYFLLVSKEAWISTHQSAVERLLRALVRAEEFVKRNAAETQRFIVNQFALDSSFVDSIWPNFDLVVTLPQALLLILEDQARWRIANGLTDKTEIPNFLELMYLDGLDAVKPDAITIIR